MARSLRSSREKTNKSRLRSNVFGPVEKQRKERLSAKLLELATSSQISAGKQSPGIDGEQGKSSDDLAFLEKIWSKFVSFQASQKFPIEGEALNPQIISDGKGISRSSRP